LNILVSAQENRYTFAHYYGNRREDGANHVHRDFAQEGGFLCPSGNPWVNFINVSREALSAHPKRAKNTVKPSVFWDLEAASKPLEKLSPVVFNLVANRRRWLQPVLMLHLFNNGFV